MTDAQDDNNTPEAPKVITGTVAIKLDPVAVANMLRRHWSSDVGAAAPDTPPPKKEE